MLKSILGQPSKKISGFLTKRSCLINLNLNKNFKNEKKSEKVVNLNGQLKTEFEKLIQNESNNLTEDSRRLSKISAKFFEELFDDEPISTKKALVDAQDDKRSTSNEELIDEKLIITNEGLIIKKIKNKPLQSISINQCDSDLITNSLKQCETLESLFKLIKKNMSKLIPAHLEVIYQQISLIGVKFKLKPNLADYDLEFIQIIQKSPIFNPLLYQTMLWIDSLTNECLLNIFKLFNLMNIHPEDRYSKAITRKLIKKLNDLTLVEIANLLKSINFSSKDLKLRSNYGLILEKKLFERLKDEIMANKFDKKDTTSVIKYLNVFLIYFDPEVLDNLIEVLTKSQLNLKQSILILKYLKQSTNYKFNPTELELQKITHLNYRSPKVLEPRKPKLPESKNFLINKCNLIIIENLNSPTEERQKNALNYLIGLHRYRDTKNSDFVKFYDAKILDLITPLLISIDKTNLSLRYYELHFIERMIYNFSRFDIYDERLLNYMYQMICKFPKFRSQLGVNIFSIFSKFRFKFVDYRKLARFLLETKKNNNLANLRILSELILFDVFDEEVLNHFDEITNNLKRGNFQEITDNNYKLISLAKVYLSTNDQMDVSLKVKLINKFDDSLNKIKKINKIPFIRYGYFRVLDNPKLQRSCFLSNGVYIDVTAIYDKPNQDLVSLANFKEYFNKIDHIPLDLDHQLVTFINRTRTTQHFKESETNYNFQLKKILTKLDIKPIEVFIDEYKDLKHFDRLEFFSQKVKDHFKKN